MSSRRDDRYENRPMNNGRNANGRYRQQQSNQQRNPQRRANSSQSAVNNRQDTRRDASYRRNGGYADSRNASQRDERYGVDTVNSITYDRASHEETEADVRLHDRTVIPKSANEPFGLRRSGLIRNRIITAIAGVAIIAGLGAYTVFVIKPFKSETPINAITTDDDDKKTETAVPDSVSEADKFIAAYYGYLANSDADGLRNLGNDAAANAIQNKWTIGIDYKVDNSVQPDAKDMPSPIGKYAGCKLYNISDFFSTPPANSVHSTITGDTGYQGWIYYDQLETRWVIVDPTIPTSVQVPESGHVAKSSEDKKATVEMTGPGAYSNPWWAYTMVSVDVTSSSADATITIQQKSLDNGITVSVPDTLTAGLSPIVASNAQQGEQQNTQQSQDTADMSQSSAVAKASGICIVYRGTTSGFTPDRIGQQALRIDCDITPVTISCGDEDITPIFAIGTSTATDIQKLLNSAQMSKYNVTSENVEKLEQEVKNMPQPSNGNENIADGE